MVAEKYAVRLSSEDRAQLEQLIRSGQNSARIINRARILLQTNAGGAVAGSRAGCGDGVAVQTNNFAVTTLSQSFRYELICQAAGGYGERVDDPADVPAALQRGLRSVRNDNRQALLNVIGQ